MKDYPDELEHMIHNEHSEHDLENESLRQIIDGLEIEENYFHEQQLFEVEGAIQEIHNKGPIEKEPAIRPVEGDMEIVYEHPVDYPEIINNKKDQNKYGG